MYIDTHKNKKITISIVQYVKDNKLLPNHPTQAYSEELFNSVGVFTATEDIIPDEKYYRYDEVIDYATKHITRTPIPLDIAIVKERMKKSIKDTFQSKADKPIVDTGLGFSVDGGYRNLVDFQIGKEFAFPSVKDSDNNFQPVTASDYDTIINAIKTSGVTLYQTKWAKEAEVDTLVDIDACILYEATPYTYTYTQEDIDNIIDNVYGIVVGDTVTRYKNNCTEWDNV